MDLTNDFKWSNSLSISYVYIYSIHVIYGKELSQQALPIELNDYFHKIMVMGLSKQKMGIINNVVTHPSFIAITFEA